MESWTLGHGLPDAGVADDFWGTEAVVDVLKQMNGYTQGCVIAPYMSRSMRTEDTFDDGEITTVDVAPHLEWSCAAEYIRENRPEMHAQ